jgi:hypothetical protein
MRRAAGIALAALLLAGCQQTITPPVNLADPVTVYVTDHGRHAGLVLPAADGGMTEWFWGDWHYFALRDRSLGSGLRALFASPQATLGRLDVAATGATAVKRATGAETLIAVAVERAAAEALQTALSARHARRRDTEIVDPDGARFVHDDGDYGLTRNSNHKVCAWLEQLGARTDCPAVVADFRVRDAPQR